MDPTSSRNGPAQRAFETLREALANGTVRPGEQMPSIRQWAARPGLSFHGVVRAYERLEALGLVEASPGRGYFALNAAGSLPASHNALSLNTEMDALWSMFHAPGHALKLGCGWLPPDWMDTQALARVIRRTASFARSSLVEYGDPVGYLPLREALCQHLRSRLGVPLSPHGILTTLGATQALDLLVRILVEPGDRVMVDDPCNSSLVRLLRLRGARVLGIDRLAQGPDLSQVQDHLSHGPVKAFFINARLHNPTGTTLSAQAACDLLRLSQHHGMRIVEDDVYGGFCSEGSQCLATLDGLSSVIHVGSFSKTLSANLRVGYVVGPTEEVARLVELKLLTSVAVPSFCERFLGALLVDGSYERHLRRVRRRLQTAQAHVQQVLRSWGWELYHQPREGMFVWIRHPFLPGTDGFIQAAARQGVLLAPGRVFSATEQDLPWLRLNVAHFDASRLCGLFHVRDWQRYSS